MIKVNSSKKVFSVLLNIDNNILLNRSALTSDDRIIIASSLLPFEVDRKDTIDASTYSMSGGKKAEISARVIQDIWKKIKKE